jgi:hypothetical protein
MYQESAVDCIMSSFVICTLVVKYDFGTVKARIYYIFNVCNYCSVL